MKWPNTLTVIRHGESTYNILKDKKKNDPLYQEFLASYNNRDKEPKNIEIARNLAQVIFDKGDYSLGKGDFETPLTTNGTEQAILTGQKLKKLIKLPDVILVSPYQRTIDTALYANDGWSDLASVPMVEDERLREKEHGLALLYGDWRILNMLHPEQEMLHHLEGEYWYRYPQGENTPDVRQRNHSLLETMTREYSGQDVLMFTHHISILALRANMERLDANQYMELDENEKPINCGVTIYRGESDQGRDGRLVLDMYNQKLY